MAGKRLVAVVEAEERLLCGGRGFTKKSWRMEVDDGRGGAGRSVQFFSFLGRVESYFQSYPLYFYHN
jgi:hypothetical protein